MTQRKHLTHRESTKFAETIVDQLLGYPVKTALDILEEAKRHILWSSTVNKPEYVANGLKQIDIEDAIKAKKDAEKNSVVPLKTRKKNANS